MLHFDTAINAMSEIFLFAFALHCKMQEKIAKSYESFKSQEKSILACSYPTFRGLEHSKLWSL